MAIDPDLRSLHRNSPPTEHPGMGRTPPTYRLHAQSFATKAAGGFRDPRLAWCDPTQRRRRPRQRHRHVRGRRVPDPLAGLVTSAGAALEGNKSIRGKLPDEIMRRTSLALVASPGRGSVVLSSRPLPPPKPRSATLVASSHSGVPSSLLSSEPSVCTRRHRLGGDRGPTGGTRQSRRARPARGRQALELAELAAAGRFDVDMTWGTNRAHAPA